MPSQARTKLAPPSVLRYRPSPIVPTYRRCAAGIVTPYSSLPLFLTGQIAQALAARRQLGLLDQHVRYVVLDLELQGAALADQMVALLPEPRPVGVHRTAQGGVEIFRTDHAQVSAVGQPGAAA